MIDTQELEARLARLGRHLDGERELRSPAGTPADRSSGPLIHLNDRPLSAPRSRSTRGRLGLVAAIAAVWVLAGVVASTGGGGKAEVTELGNATPRTGDPGWAAIAEMPIEPRFQHASVNIGGEVLVFGGHTSDRPARGAAVFDPVDGRWRQVAEPPGDMRGPTAVWTGSVVLVLDRDGRLFAYDPARDEWDEGQRSPLQTGANGVTAAVWAGDQMLVIQTYDLGTTAPPVLTYDPTADRWVDHGPAPVLGAAALVWTGEEALVLGREDVEEEFVGNDVWSFGLDTGWERRPSPPLDLWSTRLGTYAVWTGTEFVVGGGNGWTDEAVALWDEIGAEERGDPTPAERAVLEAQPLLDVAAWNPATATWRALADAPVPSVTQERYPDIWTGSEVLTWNSLDVEGRRSGGVALLDPAADTWRIVDAPATGFPQEAPATWTGRELIIVSGEPTAGDPDTSICCEPTKLATSLTP